MGVGGGARDGVGRCAEVELALSVARVPFS